MYDDYDISFEAFQNHSISLDSVNCFSKEQSILLFNNKKIKLSNNMKFHD